MNANDICKTGEIFTENEEFLICRYDVEDETVYKELLTENQPILEGCMEQLWLGTLQDEKIINCKIVCKEGEIPMWDLSNIGWTEIEYDELSEVGWTETVCAEEIEMV